MNFATDLTCKHRSLLRHTMHVPQTRNQPISSSVELAHLTKFNIN